MKTTWNLRVLPLGNVWWVNIHTTFTICCPRRDFAQKVKSGGSTLVTRAYSKESTHSWNIQSAVSMPEKISICLNRGCEESVGNDDVSIVCARKYKWLGWRKDRKSRRDRLGRFCDIYFAVILQYSFALRVISDILWGSCFESYGPKDTR